MSAIPTEALRADPLAVRVWFQSGTNQPVRLQPDQPLSTLGHALTSSAVQDGGVGLSSLSPAVLSRFGGIEGTQGTLSNGLARATSDVADLQLRLARVEDIMRRLAASVDVLSNRVDGAASVLASMEAADPSFLAAGYERFHSFTPPDWEILPVAAATPPARTDHVAAWVGEDFVVWGGRLQNGTLSGAGAAFRPGTDSWRALSPVGAPSARGDAAWAVLDRRLAVWGGFATGEFLGTGAIWDSSDGTWTPISPVGAPAGRDFHAAAWSGGRLLVWGGRNVGGLLEDGGAYDPVGGTWTPLPTAGAPSPRHSPTAVLAGRRWLVWGGTGARGVLSTGARLELDPAGVPVSWTPMNPVGAPSAREGACAAWTGTRLLVWGGEADGPLSDGAAYDPETDRWTPIPNLGAPSARTAAVAAWTGSELVVFGGLGTSGVLADGGAYDPSQGRWRPLDNPGSPTARHSAGSAWTGDDLLLFGGLGANGAVAAGERIDPQPAWHLYRKP